jgi:hypothetical protein
MKSLNRLIREEYIRLIKEAYDDEDIDMSQFDREDELKRSMFQDFLYKNNAEFTKHIPWSVIPFPRLKKIWEDYMTKGFVRDERGLEMIKDIMINNTTKISIMTNLAGHTQWGDEEAFEENIGYWVDEQLNCALAAEKPQDRSQLEIPFENPKKGYVQKPQAKQPEPCNTQVHPFVQNYVDENYNGDSVNREDIRNMLYDEMKSRFFDYYMDDPEHKMGGFISDYGLKPLETLLGQLIRSNKAETDIPIIDKMLNVIHQRSDIANWFVEGGSDALAQLSGGGYYDEDYASAVSGKYKMSDYR